MTSRSQARLLFARNFFRYPKVLGSLVPSSPFLVDQVLRHIDWSSARVIVEYGPGVGTFTREILRRMRPDAQLIAIELNADFVEYLGARYPDPRLCVFSGSALEVDACLRALGHADADAIVSGIPFSTIGLEIRERILSKSSQVLGPGGRFLVYQFSRAVLPHLRENFREIREEFVPLNILPARIYRCTK
ncbi:MAG TPA: rRNA adenine N-6-methyltransferase family protein [Longimicrobiales bacterium]|nr:rRNA adenine N-6-methyltransferase family protein [Longimicrobiales bacterium]